MGTSAGSAVAAQISSGVPLTELYARQTSVNTHERAPHIEIDDLIELFENVGGGTATSVTEAAGDRQTGGRGANCFRRGAAIRDH